MRYRKGMIALSETRDYPLLRRVLHRVSSHPLSSTNS